MTATLIDDQLTPLSIEQLAQALRDGSAKALGQPVAAECLAVLTAQACLETGNGQKLHCFNFGNVKNSKSWDGLFCRYKCDEIVTPDMAAYAARLGPCTILPWTNGKSRVVCVPPHPWTEFRAFASAVDGGAQYVAELFQHFPRAWGLAYSGNAAGYVEALGAAGYFTGDLEPYRRAVVSIAAKTLSLCQKICAGDSGALTDDERNEITGLVALTLAQRSAEDGTTNDA